MCVYYLLWQCFLCRVSTVLFGRDSVTPLSLPTLVLFTSLDGSDSHGLAKLNFISSGSDFCRLGSNRCERKHRRL
jgi:hypothetical protein